MLFLLGLLQCLYVTFGILLFMLTILQCVMLCTVVGVLLCYLCLAFRYVIACEKLFTYCRAAGLQIAAAWQQLRAG